MMLKGLPSVSRYAANGYDKTLASDELSVKMGSDFEGLTEFISFSLLMGFFSFAG